MIILVLLLIDQKLIRENPNLIRENLSKRHDAAVISSFDLWVNQDKEWRVLKAEVDGLRAKRNSITEKLNLLKEKERI